MIKKYCAILLSDLSSYNILTLYLCRAVNLNDILHQQMLHYCIIQIKMHCIHEQNFMLKKCLANLHVNLIYSVTIHIAR